MLTIHMIAVSHKQPDWVEVAYREYAKRLPAREIELTYREIKPEAREGRSIAQAMRLEADKITAALPRGALVVCLDERGTALDSVGLSQQLTQWRENTQHVALVIGGADGLDGEFKAQHRASLRLSNLTLPHGMVRVLLAEQLYRAHTIAVGHPYHRA